MVRERSLGRNLGQKLGNITPEEVYLILGRRGVYVGCLKSRRKGALGESYQEPMSWGETMMHGGSSLVSRIADR